MTTQSAEPALPPGPDHAATGDSALRLISRRQRLLLCVGGIVTTLVLAAATAVMLHSQVKDYLGERYADFVMRRTGLQALLAVREGALRISVKQEEYAQASGQRPDPALVTEFNASNGRLLLQRNPSFPAVYAIGDLSAQQPAQHYASYLRMAEEISDQAGAYAYSLMASSYFYSPDKRFIGLTPVSDADNPAFAGLSAEALIQRIAPDLGDLEDPQVAARLLDANAPLWLPPATDLLSGEPSIRLVRGAAVDGKLLAVFIASYPLRTMDEYLAVQRPYEISLMVSRDGELLSRPGDATVAADVLRIAGSLTDASPSALQYRDGYFIAKDRVSGSAWTFIHAVSWRTVLADLWPRLLTYTGAMLVLIGFVWLALLLLDRKVFRPAHARSQRIIESEDLNRTMVATAPFGLALLSTSSGQVLLHNSAMQTYADDARRSDPPLHAQLLALFTSRARQNEEVEFTLELENGSSCDLLVSGVRTKYQGADALLCNFKDITARKKTQQNLEQARHAADAANHAKSAFLATMSHEIRTPLNTILGNLELLERTPLSDGQLQQLHTVTSSSSSLLAIINDILDFSKVESGQMSIEAIAFDLAELGRQVVAFFAPVAQGKGLGLELSIDDALAPAYVGDPTRIRQVIYNLVSNAIKFTAQGDVLLEIYLQDETRDDSPILIGVSDTGIGMSDEQQAGLFQTFSQADSSIARRYGGTGLGLALCRRLAGLMDGTIQVHSEVDVGSTFIVMLPLKVSTQAPEPATTAPAGPAHDAGARQSWRILVADDHPANRQLIRMQLQTLGYASDEVEDGNAALARFAVQHYDMVMTDLNMPHMDGYTLARRLRDQGAQVPIIAITAHASEQERRRCHEVGIDEVLTKPIILEMFERCIGRWLNRPVAPAAAADKRDSLSHGRLPAAIHAALLQSLDDSLASIRASMASTDATGTPTPDAEQITGIAGHLHSMRGAFALIHETDVAEACAHLEHLLRSGDMTSLSTRVDELDTLAHAALQRRTAIA